MMLFSAALFEIRKAAVDDNRIRTYVIQLQTAAFHADISRFHIIIQLQRSAGHENICLHAAFLL